MVTATDDQIITSVEQLPYGEVFKTKHSTERNWRTANDNLILLTEVGSRLHGTGLDYDDQDMQGVCIEPPNVMLGISEFELYEYRTKPVSVRSGAGDVDLSVYGLAKWVRLICRGNPSVLMPLFAPEHATYRINWVGQALRESVGLFLSREHAKPFLGYIGGQRRSMVGERAARVNRPELVEAYGYDTKYAYHALRIAMQGIELMSEGRITLPMAPHRAQYLIDVREGKFTQSEVLEKLGRLESDLLHAAENTVKLPERVDTDYVNNWLVRTYRRWWEEQGL